MLNSPQVMGVINIAPTSFFGPSVAYSPDDALKRAIQMVNNGATIIDVGAEPTNPGVYPVVSLEQELDLAIPAIEKIARNLNVTISVDTSKPEVMRESVKCGARLINDIRSLQLPGALDAAVKLNVPVCLMHMGHEDVYGITNWLKERVDNCLKAGIKHKNIIIDPGIGAGSFGKSTEQNCAIIANLNVLSELGFPILIGVSRKTFIGDILNVPPTERLSGSLAATAIALMHNVSIVRTHDVLETAHTIKVVHEIKKWWS